MKTKEKLLIKKINRLVKAYKRSEKLLANNRDVNLWNKLHDLKSRIFERFDKSQNEYLDFHWENYGWNAY